MHIPWLRELALKYRNEKEKKKEMDNFKRLPNWFLSAVKAENHCYKAVCKWKSVSSGVYALSQGRIGKLEKLCDF